MDVRAKQLTGVEYQRICGLPESDPTRSLLLVLMLRSPPTPLKHRVHETWTVERIVRGGDSRAPPITEASG